MRGDFESTGIYHEEIETYFSKSIVQKLNVVYNKWEATCGFPFYVQKKERSYDRQNGADSEPE